MFRVSSVTCLRKTQFSFKWGNFKRREGKPCTITWNGMKGTILCSSEKEYKRKFWRQHLIGLRVYELKSKCMRSLHKVHAWMHIGDAYARLSACFSSKTAYRILIKFDIGCVYKKNYRQFILIVSGQYNRCCRKKCKSNFMLNKLGNSKDSDEGVITLRITGFLACSIVWYSK